MYIYVREYMCVCICTCMCVHSIFVKSQSLGLMTFLTIPYVILRQSLSEPRTHLLGRSGNALAQARLQADSYTNLVFVWVLMIPTPGLKHVG